MTAVYAKVAKIRKVKRDVRLVALDLDGTLFDDGKRVSHVTAEAIRDVVRRGEAKVCLVTARPPRSVRAVWEELGLDTPSIHYNGALTWDATRRISLRHKPLRGGICREMATVAREVHPEVIVHAEVMDKWYTDRDDRSHVTETAKLFEPDGVVPLEECLKGSVTKLMFLADEGPLKAVEEAIAAGFAGRVTMVRTDRDLIQITAPSVGKARALASLAAYLEVPQVDVLAVGDALNDHGMIRWAGRGVAMGNAHPDVKAVADWVAPTNEQDGVLAALRRYGVVR